jgi:hypothetical protein
MSAAAPAGLVFNFNANAFAPTGAEGAEPKADEEVADLDETPDAQGRRPIRWVKLAEGISESTYDEIEKLKIRGVYAPPRSYRRVYPNNQLAAHLIGFVDVSRGRPERSAWSDDGRSRSLSGAGLGLTWSGARSFSLEASYAHTLGDDVATAGPDSGGRFWINAVKYF